MSETSDVEELSEEVPCSLSDRFGGRARLIPDSEGKLVSRKNDDADDLSDLRLDCPVSAVLVNEWSELPDERDGESRERSEADKLGTGDLIGSLRSDDTLGMRLTCVLGLIRD